MATVKKTKTKASKAKASKSTTPKESSVDKKNVKTTKKQIVETRREVKYKYPSDVKEPLDRKAWRQKVRAQLKTLEAALGKAANNKAKSQANKELKAYQEEVLLVP